MLVAVLGTALGVEGGSSASSSCFGEADCSGVIVRAVNVFVRSLPHLRLLSSSVNGTLNNSRTVVII